MSIGKSRREEKEVSHLGAKHVDELADWFASRRVFFHRDRTTVQSVRSLVVLDRVALLDSLLWFPHGLQRSGTCLA